jgi:hypothetical protein
MSILGWTKGKETREEKEKKEGGKRVPRGSEWTVEHARAGAALRLVACPHAKELTP